MTINFNTKTIELTKNEMNAASNYGSQMYRDLMNARRDNPDFSVTEIKVKAKKKTPLSRLTLASIKAYVKAHGSPEQKREFLKISVPTVTDDGIYCPAQSFFDIKKWFLAQFPQYKATVEAYDAEIISIYNAIDAKIAADVQKSAAEARAKAEAEAQLFLEIA